MLKGRKLVGKILWESKFPRVKMDGLKFSSSITPIHPGFGLQTWLMILFIEISSMVKTIHKKEA